MKASSTKGSTSKISLGINFSTLARNAGKYFNTKVIGIDGSSPDVSPIKSNTSVRFGSTESKNRSSVERSAKFNKPNTKNKNKSVSKICCDVTTEPSVKNVKIPIKSKKLNQDLYEPEFENDKIQEPEETQNYMEQLALFSNNFGASNCAK